MQPNDIEEIIPELLSENEILVNGSKVSFYAYDQDSQNRVFVKITKNDDFLLVQGKNFGNFEFLQLNVFSVDLKDLYIYRDDRLVLTKKIWPGKNTLINTDIRISDRNFLFTFLLISKSNIDYRAAPTRPLPNIPKIYPDLDELQTTPGDSDVKSSSTELSETEIMEMSERDLNDESTKSFMQASLNEALVDEHLRYEKDGVFKPLPVDYIKSRRFMVVFSGDENVEEKKAPTKSSSSLRKSSISKRF